MPPIPSCAPKAIRRFINRIGPAHLERLFALRHADIIGSGLPEARRKRTNCSRRASRRCSRKNRRSSVRDLAISGDDVIALLIERGVAPAGFRGDARVGATLAALFEEVVDDPTRNERHLLVERAKRFIDERYHIGN